MNNYWYTNYRAYQEGTVKLHYGIYLHGKFNDAGASRLAREDMQPLLITSNKVDDNLGFKIDDPNILLSSAKPAVDGKALILRFYNASSEAQEFNFSFLQGMPHKNAKIYLSNAKEEKTAPFNIKEKWPAFVVKTLRIEE